MKIKNDFKIDFVGIGAPKCATTWIYECLKEHLQVWLPPKDQKDFSYFFLSLENSPDFSKYKSFLKLREPTQLRGDFNTYYIITPEVVKKIKEHNPNIKIIVSLRNPVDRAYSQYIHRYSLDKEEWKPFLEAIKDPKDRRIIIEFGFYWKLLKKFFDEFNRENILVMICEDIKKNPLNFIQEIYKFLGINHSFEPQSINLDVNVTSFKMTKLGKFVHQRISPALKKNILGLRIHQSTAVRRIFDRFAKWYSSSKKRRTMDKKTRDYLKEIYKEDIKKLEKLIKRDLSGWKN